MGLKGPEIHTNLMIELGLHTWKDLKTFKDLQNQEQCSVYHLALKNEMFPVKLPPLKINEINTLRELDGH